MTADDTDRHAAIRLKHLSPTGVKYLDKLAGLIIAENGGFGELNLKLEAALMTDIRGAFTAKPRNWRRVVLERA